MQEVEIWLVRILIYIRLIKIWHKNTTTTSTVIVDRHLIRQRDGVLNVKIGFSVCPQYVSVAG